jgi:hypothetical protein
MSWEWVRSGGMRTRDALSRVSRAGMSLKYIYTDGST